MRAKLIGILGAASLGWGLAGVGVRAIYQQGGTTFTVVVVRTGIATLAVVLFAQGLVGIHHAFGARRLARQLGGDDEARKILAEVRERIDGLDTERARSVLELLIREHGG